MAECYRIELQSRIDDAWFDDFDLAYSEDGNTVLTGEVADQAALHSLLARIRDLGIPILLVARLQPAEGSQLKRRRSK